jgi:hypothetical protein
MTAQIAGAQNERYHAEERAIREWGKCFLEASSVSGSLDFCKRIGLGSVPCMWEVVGPHRRVDRSRPGADTIPRSLLDAIEGALLQPAADDDKGEMPFIYVRNPPRHGKTFCLDALLGAQEHADVLKIEISHNLLYHEEQVTPFFAQRHFWTRVAERLLRQLGGSEVNPPYAMLSEWESVARACPGIDAVPIVICADELSHLLKSQTWREGGVEKFFASLARFQRAHMFEGKPMRRLVMTGFDHHLTRGIASSGLRCITYAVRPLRYREAQRLAQRLLFGYARANVDFPTALFWLVQTSPGLLGAWAHAAFDPSMATDAPRSIDEFDLLISSWRSELSDDELLPRRLQLVERFMCGCICCYCLAAALDLGIAVPRDGMNADVGLPPAYEVTEQVLARMDCRCKPPVSADALDSFALVPYALHVLVMTDSPRIRSYTAILLQLRQLFLTLEELGTFGGGRHDLVLRRLRLEAEAAGWSSLANVGRGAYRRLTARPAGVGACTFAGESFQRFVAAALRLSALCKLEAKRRRNEPAELTVGDLFPCQPGGATSRPLKHGGTFTVIEATDERTLRDMLTSCACDLFPVSVDDIIAKGDLIQRLAALRTHLTLVEKHEAVRFGADMELLREQIQQITQLTGPDGWRDQDAGILGVNATGKERLKRSGAFARAADILAEAEASLGGHTVRTGEHGNYNPVVEQLRDAVCALRAARRHPSPPQVKRYVEAALRFAEGAEGLALLAGSDKALVPDVWVATFLAESCPPSVAAATTRVPSSLDAAMKELEAALCWKLPNQTAQQQLLVQRRVLGARLLSWVLEHALSTSLPPRGAGRVEDTSPPCPSRALDMVFCRGDAPDVLQQAAFPHSFPRCAQQRSKEVTAAFLKLCGSRPKPFLCVCPDSIDGCHLLAVGASPSLPAKASTFATLAAPSGLVWLSTSVGLAASATFGALVAFWAFFALGAFALLTFWRAAPRLKRPVILIVDAAAAAARRKTEALVAGEDLDTQDRVCSLVCDVDLSKMFEFTLVLAGRHHGGDE